MADVKTEKKFASLETAKKINDDVASLKEDISNKITKFYASNQGETHITDSDNGKIQDAMLYGRSEQKQYSGKNLLELSDNRVQDGNLKFQISQGIITFSGSPDNASFNKKIKDFIVPSDGTYTISTNSDSNNESPRIIFSINGGSFESALKGATKELTTADVVSLYVRIATIGSYDGRTIKPMIEKGSEVTSYEPYTGGQPSPSPDYPQEIKSVVNPTVKVCGSNIYDYKNANETNTVLNPNGEEIAVTGYITSDYIPVLDGIYIKSDNNRSDPLRIGLYTEKKEWKIRKDITNSMLYVSSSDAKFIRLSYSKSDVSEIYVSYADIFEPYTVQTVTLPYTLNAIPVSSGGNVTINGQQYIADYVDVERGKLMRMCKEKVFDGTGKWYSESSYMILSIQNFSYVDNDHKHMEHLLCNKYKVSTTIGGNDKIIFIRINGDGVVIKDTLHQSTVDDWKKYLNDNPCIVHCISAIPEEIDLTPEEITALKALATYYPTTNISVNSKQLDGYTVFNYPISMENGWNYVKQQLNDNRDYIYDMDLQSAEAYVNSEYAVVLTELEVM